MADIEVDVIIVGAGFGGCLALNQMRRRGLSARIIESREGFGGVWYSNRYPGARVDSIMPFYQFTNPELYKDFTFTEKYPDGAALREYFDFLDKKLDLGKDTVFGHRVTKAEYSDVDGKWKFETNKGLHAESHMAIFAAGTTHKAHIPNVPNLDSFKGQIIHPADWPANTNFDGKRIGLVGQGASGIQILEQLAGQDQDITLFIRNPCLALPMRQERCSIAEKEADKDHWDSLFSRAKYGKETGYPYIPSTSLFDDETPEQHRQVFEERWRNGGLTVTGGYQDMGMNPSANRAMYNFWAEKTRARMTDAKKKDIVAPVEQFQWIGGKRPALEQEYFEMIDKPNVKLVSLKETPISEVAESGIVVADEKGRQEMHKLDVLIFATGYDSVTGGLYDMNVTDRNGRTLQQKWNSGIQTYGGMMVSDMPNAFFLYGPQAPTALANAPTFLELQMELIENILDEMRVRNVRSTEVTDTAAKWWSDKTFSIWNSLKAKDQDSWWVGANIPGKKREPLIWFGGTKLWWDLCMEGLKDWTPFVSKF